MGAKILDGRSKAQDIKKDLVEEISQFDQSIKKNLRLAVLQSQCDEASSVYINCQKKIAAELGISYESIALDSSSQEESISAIQVLNKREDVAGIFIQHPLREGFRKHEIYSSISPDKDVEGINPENLGRLFIKSPRIVPPTVLAVMELIKLSGVSLYGKEVTIIGHSDIVGKPLSILLLNEFATVSVCHIATSQKGDLQSHVKRADVLVAAVGKPNLIKGEWVKDSSLVIDVGINMVDDKLVGDIEFDVAKEKASFITPVPGGVGPLTTIMLMSNCVKLFKLQRGLM
ncbi:bifunctional 5,10-methylenetetrahydrofolate dehydrogenase/5,10-methenyltetrahydrofolate cyclohydrolase [Candidatus Omnitrophota bacterium]